jgi:hypothetical protein
LVSIFIFIYKEIFMKKTIYGFIMTAVCVFALVFAGASFTGCEFISGLFGWGGEEPGSGSGEEPGSGSGEESGSGGGENPEEPGEHVLPSTLYVRSKGSEDNSGETENDPLPTIAAALVKVEEAAKDPSWPGKSGVAIVLLDTVTVADGNNSISNGGTGYPPLTLRAHGTGYSLIEVYNGSLTLRDITLQGRDDNTAALVTVIFGHLTLEAGAVIKDNKGGGVYLDEYSGTFTMNDGTISGNTGGWGGGVGVESGTFTMNGGTIEGNKVAGGGGGVFLSSGTFTMNGGIIAGNTADAGGGGVYVAAGANFTKTSKGGIIYGTNEGVDTLKNSPDAVYYPANGNDEYGRADTLNVSDSISTNDLTSGWQ